MALVLGSQGIGLALTCPSQPEQISKDFEGEVNVEVGKIGPVKGGALKAKAKQTTRDLLQKAPERDRVYLEQMMYASYCTSLQDNTTLSPGERTRNIQDYNAVVRGTFKARKSAYVPSPSKAPGKEKERVARSGSRPTVMPPLPSDTKLPVVEKPCDQPITGLTRPPEEFLSSWSSTVRSLPKKRLVPDLQNLFALYGRIPVGLTGKDLIREALFTLTCMEQHGEVTLKKLGSPGNYWGENFDNQMIIYRTR